MKLSAFSINTIFIVLMLLGIALLPSISLQLMPSTRSNELSVSFTWANANPEMLEMEVTSKLEGAFARIKGLNNISSETGYGYGTITLFIDKDENIDAIKLYLSSLIRSLSKGLPEGVKIGTIHGGELRRNQPAKEAQRLLLSYTITGPGNSLDVAAFAEDHVSPVITRIPGIENVSITGAIPFEWVLYYDTQLLQNLKISPHDISTAIHKYYSEQDGGKVLLQAVPEETFAYIVFKGKPQNIDTDFLEIPIKSIDGKVIYLKNIATLDYNEASPSSYYRINGLNRININIFCEKNSNMLNLSAKVRGSMEELAKSFPKTHSVKMILDNSQELKDELGDNLLRMFLTIVILLFFVWLTSRSWRYLLIITVCLAANTLIALVFYYLFNIEIHLYSLAGITVSFGIIIDNVIIMVDHYRHHHNRKVFMAILAATLTTMGALVVIFNMNNEIMRNMWGFSSVIIINLTISILTALFFVPALMEKLTLAEPDLHRHYRHLRRTVRFTCHYERVVRFIQRHRIILFIIILLGFGLPVFLIPTTINREKPMAEFYNRIFSSEFYLQIKPWVDKSLGGSLRLFIEGEENQGQHDPSEKARTILNLTMTMPHGASLEQMNEAFVKIEQFLTAYKEIETFISDINSPNLSRMTITFKKEEELTGAPEKIKNDLIRFANTIGNADSDISGVGRGFSNRSNSEYRSESLKVIGYNYRNVLIYADQLKCRLEQQKRVKNLYIGGERSPDKTKEYAIEVSKEKLARNNSDISSMLSNLRNLSGSGESRAEVYINRKLSPLIIRPTEQREASLWELQNRPLQGKKSAFRLEDVGHVGEAQNFESISKNNQEYEVVVQYDFIGDYMLSKKAKERISGEMNRDMPVGFRIKADNRWGDYSWESVGGIDARIWYILLVITIIYFICAILLESLRQALVVITIAPLSFIGCFLGFYFFGMQFNEGSLAAFIMMCGLSVNAILYIINDYNNRVNAGRPRGLQTYLKAYNAKIIPILLTIISTMLGFIPFLIGEVNDFWFSLAIGTMSGLGFSLLILIGVLPMMFKVRMDGAERIQDTK